MALDFPQNPQLNDIYTSDTTTWQFDGTAWNIVSSVDTAEIPNAFSNIAVDGEDTVQADSATDTLTVIAGSNISLATNPLNDSLTINSTATGSGITQNLFATINADSGTTSADSDTDTLTIAGGSNVNTSISGDVLTISASVTGSGSSAFTELTDAANANLTVDKIYLPAITRLVVDNIGAQAYVFDQYGVTNNPDIYAISGTTISFDLNAIGGHPFLIQDATGSNFNEGLIHVTSAGEVSTGGDAQGQQSGTLYWKIPITANGGFRYQCAIHAGMVGLISIKNFVSI